MMAGDSGQIVWGPTSGAYWAPCDDSVSPLPSSM